MRQSMQKLSAYSRNVIALSNDESGQVSLIFVRQKKDGSYHMILNLKALNENVEYKKFKMETFHTQSCLKILFLCIY